MLSRNNDKFYQHDKIFQRIIIGNRFLNEEISSPLSASNESSHHSSITIQQKREDRQVFLWQAGSKEEGKNISII